MKYNSEAAILIEAHAGRLPPTIREQLFTSCGSRRKTIIIWFILSCGSEWTLVRYERPPSGRNLMFLYNTRPFCVSVENGADVNHQEVIRCDFFMAVQYNPQISSSLLHLGVDVNLDRLPPVLHVAAQYATEQFIHCWMQLGACTQL
jgi:hypothetical protein